MNNKYRVTYQLGEQLNGSFSSNSYSRHEVIVEAFGPNQARDMVIAMNGGPARCQVVSSLNA